MTKKNLFYFAMTIMTITVIGIIIELAAQVYFWRLEKVNVVDRRLYDYDDELGWRLNDGTYKQTHFDFEVEYTIKEGERLTINKTAASDMVINLYGDSFAFGVGVTDEDTIASKISTKTKASVNNYGVSGYGPDQYWLKYAKTAKENDYNIFLIYTGNDYSEINSRTAGHGNKEKPFFEKAGNTYRLIKPQKITVPEPVGDLRLKSVAFLRQVTKGIPLFVRIRNYFVKPDYEYMRETMERFGYIYKNTGKNDIFVIVPSISLVKGISVRTNEGLFESEMDAYLHEKDCNYLNLYRARVLSENDFFQHEGHPNSKGNEKVASAIADFLLATVNKEE